MKLRLIFFLLICFGLVSGFGMAPARSKFDFASNAVLEGSVRIIVDEVPTKIVLVPEGFLGKYVQLEKEVFIAEEEETWVNFKINLPGDLPPGELQGGIVAMQVPKDTTQENTVMATAAITHQLRVNVPYPGKFLVGKPFIQPGEKGKPVIFTFAISNYGKEKIEKAVGSLEIKGPTNEVSARVETDKASVMPGETAQLVAEWTPENDGLYYMSAVVDYDSKLLELAEPFKVGGFLLELDRLEVNNFKIGQIAKVDIYLLNRWNEPVNVDSRVEVSKDGQRVASFNSMPAKIEPRSSAVVNAYWNTEGIEVGKYDFHVVVNYQDKTFERLFSSVVSIDKVTFSDRISGKVTENRQGSLPLLGVAVVVLIILNIFLFIYINKKLTKKDSP
ncbi:MAG: hypothetical protein HGA85_03255 [Nanoarchaeota archaeon]|nr:hypothetical protein [Nanoarchaeota archaeon]